MVANPNNPVGYGKKFQNSQLAKKHFRKTAKFIIRRRAEVAEMWYKGWTKRAIAEELDVSFDTVGRDLKVLTYQLLNGGLVNASVVMVRSMARLEALMRFGWDKLDNLPKHQTGGKVMEEIRKCLELQTKIVGAGEMNTRNVRVQSITANLTKEQIDEAVQASLNEFEPLIEIAETGGDLLHETQKAQQ